MSKPRTGKEWAEFLDAKMAERAAAIVPLLEGGRVFLTGTPFRNAHMGQFVPLTPESREHIDVMEYTARFHHQRSVERLANREAGMLMERGIPAADLDFVVGHPVQGPNVVSYLRHKPTGSRLVSFPPTPTGPSVDRHEERIAAVLRPPQPPTLREWLGDRVSELGRWADVLREHPVPAGMIVAWHWDHSGPEWLLIASDKEDRPGCGTHIARDLRDVLNINEIVDEPDTGQPYRPTDVDCWLESLQMALFTRHPDVKPEPKPAACPWDPYPEVL